MLACSWELNYFGNWRRISGVRTARGRRLGPQVAVSVGGAAGGEAGDGGRGKEEEGGGTVKKQNLHTG